MSQILRSIDIISATFLLTVCHLLNKKSIIVKAKEAFVTTYVNKDNITMCFGLLEIIIWVLSNVKKVRGGFGTYKRNNL